jgi:hypothetical protein
MDYLSTRAVDKSEKKWFSEKMEQNHPMQPVRAGR